MKRILLLAILHICFLCAYAQVPVDMQTDEMKEMIGELKKEIVVLEADIKKAEKDDPEAVASMKMQLNTFKTMLASFNTPKPAQTKSKSAAPSVKSKLPQTPSPITPVFLKQHVIAPATAQANDRFFWYKGKKINDSTLVTASKTLVQFSRKRNMLIVQPDEKKDSFFLIAKEIIRSEKRKQELVDQFDKAQNAFIYYPYITTSLAIYDDLSVRFWKAANNTISLNETSLNITVPKQSNSAAVPQNGPNALLTETFVEEELLDGDPNLLKSILEQLDDAQNKLDRLPSVQDFPAPPSREPGRCATCDTTGISRQRKLDEQWTEVFQGKEAGIFRQAISAIRSFEIMGVQESGDLVYQKFDRLRSALSSRMKEKESILLDRHGNKLQYLHTIIPVILGNERQRQLLGTVEESAIGEIVSRTNTAYREYYDEQVAAKNHDFVLNIPFHIGIYRQLALLGDESSGSVQEYLEQLSAYNRFALTMEMDFVWQRDADGKLQLRATGTMETARKIYVWLYPDSCSYRIMAHGTDLDNKQFEDITLPMSVKGGIKTVREDEDKLKDYPYQGAPEYAFRFPDSRIDFCNNGPDTLFLAVIGGNEAVAARASVDMQNINKAYTIDMLMYAGQVMSNEDVNQMLQGTHDAGDKMLNTISGFMQQRSPETTLEKLRIRYEGYMQMDNLRKSLEGSVATKTAKILFNVNNRSTVLTDTYLDTKRKMEEDVEVKRGMFHLRIVHEPLK